jgi:hypothetical protein
MNLTLDYLKSSRKWLVSGLVVWGNADSFDAAMVYTEHDSSKRVIFARNSLSGLEQKVSFADLTDLNGNTLPPQIIKPAVIIIPRNQAHCYLVGKPSSTSFKIAYTPDPDSAGDNQGLVDLLILEMDLP